MAKINFGGLAQDVRGSQNGLTYSRNAGGAYVRAKVSPVQPRTPRQLAVRQAFANNSKAWSGILTQAERNQWTAFAAANPITDVFGNSITLSGLSCFNRLNQVLANVGVAMILTPPVDLSVPGLPPPTALTAVSGGSATITLTTAAQSVVAGAKYYIFATPPMSPGVNPNQSAYRFVAAYAPTASAVTINIYAAWAAIFGALISTKNVWVLAAVVNVTSGALTPPLKLVGTTA